MSANRSVGLTFVPAAGPFTVTVTVNGPSSSSGRVVALQPLGAIDCGVPGGPTCTAIVAAGAAVVLRPDDATLELNRFAGWSGCDAVGTLFTCTVTMTSDRTLIATLRP